MEKCIYCGRNCCKGVKMKAYGNDADLSVEDAAKVMVDAMEWVLEYCNEIGQPELLTDLEEVKISLMDLMAMLLDFRNSFDSKPSV